MSMQRVLETARKFGLPVIVTDVAGRDPMVMMPLEQFEALTDGGSSMPEPRMMADVPRSMEQEVRVPIVREKVEFSGVSEQKPSAEPTKAGESQGAELTMEEQFFLEPVDDEGTE